jgi:hypothetical protein
MVRFRYVIVNNLHKGDNKDDDDDDDDNNNNNNNNNNITLTVRYLPGYGRRRTNSGVRQYLGSSGHGEISSFNVPGIHFSFFITEHGRFRSCKNLKRSSSRKRSLSCVFQNII